MVGDQNAAELTRAHHLSWLEGTTRRDLGRLLNVSATMRDEIVNQLLSLGAASETTIGKTTRLHAMQAKLQSARINLNGA